MGEFVVLRSKENLEELADFCTEQLYLNYKIKRALKYKNNQLFIKKKFLTPTMKIVAFYIICKFLTEKLISYLYEDFDYKNLFDDIKEILKPYNKDYIFVKTEDKLTLFSNEFKYINLDGFLRFGLNGDKHAINELSQKVLCDIRIEEDIEEFIKLLQFYVETEPSGCDTLNVVIEPYGVYKYFDENNQDITEECIKEFYREFSDNDATQDDILISVLILKTPSRIMIYDANCEQKNNFYNTLKEIFGDRLIFQK